MNNNDVISDDDKKTTVRKKSRQGMCPDPDHNGLIGCTQPSSANKGSLETQRVGKPMCNLKVGLLSPTSSDLSFLTQDQRRQLLPCRTARSPACPQESPQTKGAYTPLGLLCSTTKTGFSIPGYMYLLLTHPLFNSQTDQTGFPTH